MKPTSPRATEEDRQYKCGGQIDPFDNEEINFKGMCLQDGPSGINYAKRTSISWQSSINNAMTFDKKLMYKIGKAHGEEAKEKGINVILEPCVNIMRNPKGGRVWESFGDDPYYVGVCFSNYKRNTRCRSHSMLKAFCWE